MARGIGKGSCEPTAATDTPVKRIIIHLKALGNDFLPRPIMPRNPTRHRCVAQGRPRGSGCDITLNRDVFLVGRMAQLNLRLTHCVHLANRVGEVAQRRPSCAAKEDVCQRLLLLWPAPLVYVEDNTPRRVWFIVAVTSGQNDREIREINDTSAALDDTPREGKIANAVGGAPTFSCAIPPTGADGFAVTHFVVGSTDSPGYVWRHVRPPHSQISPNWHGHSVGWKDETRGKPRRPQDGDDQHAARHANQACEQKSMRPNLLERNNSSQ